MELVIADQIRLSSTPDGRTWSTGWGGYAEFEAYRGGFERVSVACRLEHVPDAGEGALLCDGPGVSFLGMPYYVGPTQYLRVAPAVRKRVSEIYRPKAAYLLRMPSQMGTLFMRYLTKRGHPFAIIVMADPFKGFDRKSCGHAAWRFLQWQYTKALREACRDAAAVAYVTSRSLQSEYPPGHGFVADFSDVVLTDDWYIEKARLFEWAKERTGWKLLHVGAFNQPSKAQDTLLRAVALCEDAGLPVRATFVGDGRYRQAMERLASNLNLSGAVSFVGEVPLGAAIRKHLDDADLFILPSRTEGLPRALLEAMARGLPCVASNVGGIPELLDSEYLVPPDRPDLLFRRISEVLSIPGRLTEMSARSLSVSRRYHWTKMAPRRRSFLDHLRYTTEAWVKRQSEPAAALIQS